MESTDCLLPNNTGRILYPIFHFFSGMDLDRFEVWHHYMRKIGHVVGYFMLSLLLFRAWRATLPAHRRDPLVRAMGNGFLVDDRPRRLPGRVAPELLRLRTGPLADVVLDSSAAFIAQLVIWMFLRRVCARIGQSSTACLNLSPKRRIFGRAVRDQQQCRRNRRNSGRKIKRNWRAIHLPQFSGDQAGQQRSHAGRRKK